jgi:hypothetical protein
VSEYLDLADYLLIAEAVLGVSADEIARWPGIGLADSALHAPAASFAGVEMSSREFSNATPFRFRDRRDGLRRGPGRAASRHLGDGRTRRRGQ